MQLYASDLYTYHRLPTRQVMVGNVAIGNGAPITIQTMTTTDTMDTEASVAQCIRCIEAGAQLVRITAPSKNEAENLQNIKDALAAKGYHTPLVADIHFTPNAAEIAARIVQKVRVNPGNYVDKKKFEQIEYTDAEYAEEIERITERFSPLVHICKEYGTTMRIGTNHGSLSDRIMSRYGDSAIGMVESALEFLRIARSLDYHNIVLSMKSSNPQVMVQAYRLLIQKMMEEFGECYPLHLGVTEAGDGEDGRIKSAVGIGTLLEDGIGDTIRVSLTEDPEFEIPVCQDIVARYQNTTKNQAAFINNYESFSAYQYQKRKSFAVKNIGGGQVPVVVADLSGMPGNISAQNLQSIGYTYHAETDKWAIADAAADYVFIGDKVLDFAVPGTLGIVVNYNVVVGNAPSAENYYPIFEAADFMQHTHHQHSVLNFVMIDAADEKNANHYLQFFANSPNVVLCFSCTASNAMQCVRSLFWQAASVSCANPVVLITESTQASTDKHLIHFATETGALFLDGYGDGICLGLGCGAHVDNAPAQGRTYLPVKDVYQFINNTAFGILQATRTRISKTEYISCPSCGRTLFDLQETTAKIRSVTHHLKGLKIAIMGCIVNGPGEMADADFGYVGSGPGKITLYKGREVVKKNIPSDVAVGELIDLLKESGVWVEM
jgi:(E)-4-hydroxy-3-methylbut-2-enyl-diphosphate synthase